MKQFLFNQIKNLKGWKTQRKLLAFAVDDYGNLRLHSKNARENLIKSQVRLSGRFDEFDALDSKQDYESLFGVLSSVKDSKGRPAVFTPYALPCNIDFEKSKEQSAFFPENLNKTYERMAAHFPNEYEGAFEIMHEGIQAGLIKPQFHGREHLNVYILNKLLESSDPSLTANIANFSMAGQITIPEMPDASFTQAFAFNKAEHTIFHDDILKDGLRRFKDVYGYESITFTPPSQTIAVEKYPYLEQLGIQGIHKGLKLKRRTLDGAVFYERAKLGVAKNQNHVSLLRNVAFEPTDNRGFNWVDFSFKQIEASFFWKKPAVISSHRVNFCGHISENNRKKGLHELQLLLNKVVKHFPDVEFVALDTLTKIILDEHPHL
jgi:hypothetical protein